MSNVLIATNDIRPDLRMGGRQLYNIPPAGGPHLFQSRLPLKKRKVIKHKRRRRH